MLPLQRRACVRSSAHPASPQWSARLHHLFNASARLSGPSPRFLTATMCVGQANLPFDRRATFFKLPHKITMGDEFALPWVTGTHVAFATPRCYAIAVPVQNILQCANLSPNQSFALAYFCVIATDGPLFARCKLPPSFASKPF